MVPGHLYQVTTDSPDDSDERPGLASRAPAAPKFLKLKKESRQSRWRRLLLWKWFFYSFHDVHLAEGSKGPEALRKERRGDVQAGCICAEDSFLQIRE